ncbi:MAG: lipid-A-disaccharide synthase-related protein [Deinococcota bacterium]
MARVLFLSNGYGEDAIGSKLARELIHQCPELSVQAYPTVDQGRAYEGICPILGPRQVMPSGGLLLHSLGMFLNDMRAGFVGMTWRQLRELNKLEADMLIVVGDVYALSLSLLVTTTARFYVQPLVSAYHQPKQQTNLNRMTMERFTSLERYLIRTKVTQMYVRDTLTAQTLSQDGLSQVQFLGNPMVDGLAATKPLEPMRLRTLASQADNSGPIIALLPGTRDYAGRSLEVMLAALEQLPNATGVVAWAGQQLPHLSGWQAVHHPQAEDDSNNNLHKLTVLHRGARRVLLYQSRFNDVLAAADMVLGTAGTAHEQAAALGLPVLSFALPPHYTPAFLANQQRLLADALTISSPEPSTLARGLNDLWHNDHAREGAKASGRARMGLAGGSSAIAADILSRWATIVA